MTPEQLKAEIIFNKHSWKELGAISPSKRFCVPAMLEYASIVSNEKDKEIAELRGLIEKASWLVGNPGCNISSSTDLACDSWQKEWEQFKSSNNL